MSILKRIGLGLLILVAVALIADGFMALWTEVRLQRKIAAIRAAGDPTSIADLAPKPIPEDENAAAIVAELGPRLDAFSKEYGQFLEKTPLGKGYDGRGDRGLPATAEQIEAIRGILNKYSDIDAGLAAAAASDKYASVADYSLEHDKFLDQQLRVQMPRFRTAARFLDWRMEELVAAGQQGKAIECGIESLKLARQYDLEPTNVNMLVAIAVRRLAADSIYDALAAGPVSPETHAALDRELALHEDPQRLVHALKTERAFAIDVQMGLPPGTPQPPAWLYHMFGWPVKRFYLGTLDYLDDEIAAAGQPWTEGHTMVGRRQAPQEPSGHGMLADLMIPATQAAYDADARSTAVLRSLRIFNALRQFAENNGRDAANLGELGLPKEATTDPFSGAPLKLKHTDDGWIVYSVMKNGVDDGGSFIELKDFGVAPRRLRQTEKPEQSSDDKENATDQ